MDSSLTEPAQQLVAVMAHLGGVGLNAGRAGNASVRGPDGGFLITPSGIHPRDLTADQIVNLAMECEKPSVDTGSGVRPSSEWAMHRDIYRSFADIKAIVHTHSTYATALACARRSIPAFHYMVAVAGGDSIECAPYATFGTQTLSRHVVEALEGRKACLLANHGLVACGLSLAEAADLANEVEQLAKQYVIVSALGGQTLLNPEQMEEVLEKFQNYGKRTD